MNPKKTLPLILPATEDVFTRAWSDTETNADTMAADILEHPTEVPAWRSHDNAETGRAIPQHAAACRPRRRGLLPAILTVLAGHGLPQPAEGGTERQQECDSGGGRNWSTRAKQKNPEFRGTFIRLIAGLLGISWRGKRLHGQARGVAFATKP
jgi:hypothetical protein